MYVRVRVTPHAKKELVTIVAPTELQISVREPRERNLANMRVRELVARHFGVDVKKVHLIAGHRSIVKMFSIDVH